MTHMSWLFARHQVRLWRNALRRDSRNRGHVIGVLIVLPLWMAFLYVGTLYFVGYSGLDELGILAGYEATAARSLRSMSLETLTVSSTTASIVLCLGSLDQAFETFYLGRDLPILLAAPIPRWRVFIYKYLLNMRWDTTMVLAMAMPIWLAFGAWQHASLLFYVALVACWAALVAIVSGIGSLLAMVVSRHVPAPRLRQLTLTVGLGLGLLVVMLIQGFVTGAWTQEGIRRMLESQALSRQVWLPPIWLSNALVSLLFGDTRAAMPWMVGLVMAAGGFLALGGCISTRVYAAGWSRSQDSPSRRQRGGQDRVGRRWRPMRFLTRWPLVRKDLILFARQPTQWYQVLLGTVVIAMVVANVSAGGSDAASGLVLSLVMANVGAGTVGMNLALRGVSREGQSWWVIQSAPLPARTILRSKYMASLAPTGIYAGLSLIAMQRALRVPLAALLVALPTVLAMAAASVAVDVAIGIARTDFERASETRNADVVAVLASQSAKYLLLAPALALLGLPAVLTGAIWSQPLAIAAMLAGVYLPVSALLCWAALRYGREGLAALLLSGPPLAFRVWLWRGVRRVFGQRQASN